MSQSPFALGNYYELPDRCAVVNATVRTTRDGYAITATFVRLDVAERTDERTWTVRSSTPVSDLASDGWAVDTEAIAKEPIQLEPAGGAEVDQLLARSAARARLTATAEERQARDEIMELRAEVAAIRSSHPTVASLELLAIDLARQGQVAPSEVESIEEQADPDLPTPSVLSQYARGLGDAFTNAAKNIQRQIISVETTGAPPEPRYDDALDPDRKMAHEEIWSERERRRQYGIFNGPTSDFPDPADASLVVRYSDVEQPIPQHRNEVAPTFER
ncbi:UNVERIFIED_CONTAM: hypothetical protein DES50_12325 [Williamsia faeni]